MTTFVLTDTGLRFDFDEYAAGATHVEGHYSVTLPYATLADILRAGGPVSKLMAK